MSEIVTDKPVDLRIVRSRKSLMDAFFALMQEKSFQKISVRDITKRAMVNRSTFYAHFSDKYDLFAVATDQRVRADLDEVLGSSKTFSEENIRKLISVTCHITRRFIQDCMPTLKGDLQPLLMSTMQNSIYEFTLNWANNLPNKGQQGVSPESLAMITTGMIFGSVNIWVQDDFNLSVDELADRILPLFMNGIGSLIQ